MIYFLARKVHRISVEFLGFGLQEKKFLS